MPKPTHKDANAARAQYSEALTKLGAHAIGIDKVDAENGKVFGVVAYFSDAPDKPVPKLLRIKTSGKSIDVPLVINVEEEFTPE